MRIIFTITCTFVFGGNRMKQRLRVHSAVAARHSHVWYDKVAIEYQLWYHYFKGKMHTEKTPLKMMHVCCMKMDQNKNEWERIREKVKKEIFQGIHLMMGWYITVIFCNFCVFFPIKGEHFYCARPLIVLVNFLIKSEIIAWDTRELNTVFYADQQKQNDKEKKVRKTRYFEKNPFYHHCIGRKEKMMKRKEEKKN